MAMEVRDWVAVAQLTMVPVLGWVGSLYRGLNAKVDAVREAVMQQNGRLGRVEQRQTDHDAHDAQNFDDMREQIRELRQRGPLHPN